MCDVAEVDGRLWCSVVTTMGNRISGRSRHNKPILAEASTSSTRAGKSPPSSGSVSVRLRAAAVRVVYRRGGRSSEQVVSCPDLGDEGVVDGQTQLADRTPDGDVGDMPDLKVYRSYGGALGEMNTPDADVTTHGGRLTVMADSVPDIKIYRRSAVLYNEDDDDNLLHHSNYHRFVHPSFVNVCVTYPDVNAMCISDYWVRQSLTG